MAPFANFPPPAMLARPPTADVPKRPAMLLPPDAAPASAPLPHDPPDATEVRQPTPACPATFATYAAGDANAPFGMVILPMALNASAVVPAMSPAFNA